MEKHFILNKVPYVTVFISISEELQEERLIARGDSVNSIQERKKDLDWFVPGAYDLVYDTSQMTAEEIADNLILLIEQNEAKEQYMREKQREIIEGNSDADSVGEELRGLFGETRLHEKSGAVREI